MTRKDFRLLAAALRASVPDDEPGPAYTQWAADVVSIADALQSTNPRFDRQRFIYAAAGGNE